MATKDFNSIQNTRTRRAAVTATGEAKPEKTKEELRQFENEMRTQGRKGCKLTRTVIGFTPESYRFVKAASRIAGKSYSEFIDVLVKDYRKNNPELTALIKRAQEILGDE